MIRTTWRWILSLWAPHKRLVLPLLILTLLNGIAVASVPMAIRGVFATLEEHFTTETLRRSLLVLMGAGLARFLIYASLQNMRAWMNSRLDWSIRSRIFRHLLLLGPRFYTRYTVGDLVTRLTDDISDDMKLSWFLCSAFFRCLEALCVVGVVAATMAHMNTRLTLWCLVPLPLLFAAFAAVSGRLEKRFAVLQQALSNVNSEIEATLTGIHLVKAYRMEEVRQEAFHGVADARRTAEMGAVRGQVAMESIYGYAWQVCAGIVLWVGGAMVIHDQLTLADFVAFNGLSLSLTMPMLDIGQFLTRGRQCLVLMERLQDLENAVPEVVDGGRDVEAPGSYRLEAATYRYESSRPPSVSAVDLGVRSGALVAIVGRVGQGKTTLLRLVLRLVDPSAGRVYRGDGDLRDLTLSSARLRVGYVPQDPILLSDTIGENIRFGRPDVDDAAIRRAIRMAQLEEELAQFQHGLDTRVGPRGLQLSGGQKQRVSLARALADRPRVLVLDDCTASLDADTEARLWETLRRELPDVTVIVVTHRTAELECADEILVLGTGGAVIQRGTHRHLIDEDGEYRTLYLRWHEVELN